VDWNTEPTSHEAIITFVEFFRAVFMRRVLTAMRKTVIIRLRFLVRLAIANFDRRVLFGISLPATSLEELCLGTSHHIYAQATPTKPARDRAFASELT
jgi:hypothetical protein